MMFFLVFMFSIVLLLSISLWWDRRRCNVPGPMPLPIIGNGHQFMGDSTHFLKQLASLCQTYGDAAQVFMLHQRFVILWDAKLIEPLLSSTEYIDKADMYRFSRAWLGFGLLTSTGNRWKSHRKFITPAFHFNILQTFLPVFTKNSNILTDKLKQVADGRTVDVFPLVALAALDNVVETAMGVSIDAQKHCESKYVKAVSEISIILSSRIFNAFLSNDFLYNLHPLSRRQTETLKVLHGYTRKVVQERRSALQESGVTVENYEDDSGLKKKCAFLDLLLLSDVNGKQLDMQSIYEEVDTFMFEGHDTTTSAISFVLYCLSNHAEAQQKVFDEQKALFGDDFDRDPTSSDLQQMKYLDLVIKESLRLYPAVPFIARKMTKAVDLEGYRIPEDTTVMFDIMFMQRQSKYFESPLEFRPERFSEKYSHLYSWIPFSAGPRNCIGQKFAMMEMKLTVSRIVKSFEILPSGVEPVLGAELVLRSKNGVQVKFLPRNLDHY